MTQANEQCEQNRIGEREFKKAGPATKKLIHQEQFMM